MNLKEISKSYDSIISLGGTCQVAHQLRRLNLRKASYPFDWLVTLDVDKVIDAIDTNFYQWLDIDNLTEIRKSDNNHRIILDNKYKILHQHIFPAELELKDSYNDIIKIVNRRIDRFYADINSNKKVLLIRTNCSMDECIRLVKKYGKRVNLLIVNHTKKFSIEEVKNNLSNTAIVNIYDANENKGTGWEGYNDHWTKILSEISLNEKLYKNLLPQNGLCLSNGKDFDNKRVLYKDGVSFGPYIYLKKGSYIVTIEGENLKKAYFDVFDSGEILKYEKLEYSNTIMKYRIDLFNAREQIEFRVHNYDAENNVILKKIDLEEYKNKVLKVILKLKSIIKK